MIIFDYQCSKCGFVEEKIVNSGNDIKSCTKCNSVSKRIFTPTKFHPFKSFVCNDLGDNPVEISSWKQLDKECRRRGLDYSIGKAKNSTTVRPRSKLKKSVEENKRAFA